MFHCDRCFRWVAPSKITGLKEVIILRIKQTWLVMLLAILVFPGSSGTGVRRKAGEASELGSRGLTWLIVGRERRYSVSQYALFL